MIILFGFRSYLKTVAMLMLVCQNCQNPAAHRVMQVTRKFTLFFIPLFPIGRSRYVTCTFCGANTRLTKEQADQLVASAQNAQPQVAQQPAPATAQQLLPPSPPPPPST